MPVFGGGLIGSLDKAMGAWCRKTNTQSIPEATVTAVNFDTGETFDNPATGYSQIHDPSSNPSRFILRETGIWIVAGQLSYQGAGTVGLGKGIQLRKNGATNIMFPIEIQAVASAVITLNICAIVEATAVTDYIEMCAYHDAPGGTNIGDYGGGTFFGVAYLGKGY